jgi:hypothetical protein
MHTMDIGREVRGLVRRTGTTLETAARDVEQRLLAAEGRRSLRAKVASTRAVGRRALTAGLITGFVAAALVVARDVRRRRRFAR